MPSFFRLFSMVVPKCPIAKIYFAKMSYYQNVQLPKCHIEVFKILNGYGNIDRNMFFSISRKIAELEDMR